MMADGKLLNIQHVKVQLQGHKYCIEVAMPSVDVDSHNPASVLQKKHHGNRFGNWKEKP